MQAEGKHNAQDQSSQPRTEPEPSKQYNRSFPLISFKFQQDPQTNAAPAPTIMMKTPSPPSPPQFDGKSDA
jgi:hypothetical protein